MKKLLEYLQKIADLNYIATLMHWEMDTIAPKASFDYLIEVKTKIELEAFKLSTSQEFKKMLEETITSQEYQSLSFAEQTYLNSLLESYNRESLVPADFYAEYTALCSKANTIWLEAKEKKDYQIFKPYLAKVISFTKKYYTYKYPNSKNLYNDMLNEYEKGLTSDLIDPLFAEIKKELIPLIKQLKPINKIELNQTYTNEELLSIAKTLLEYIGFSNDRGALGIYPHGYTCKLNNNDVRITFSNNKSIFDHVCTVIHEGGHGIFEQNIGSNLSQFPIYDIDKYALHESQSRFFENILGRNLNFWLPIYDKIKDKLKLDLSVEDFVKQLNIAKPSLIRTEADELTYCFHIILRYEIEKDLFNNQINIDDLPNIWNKKMQEYLNITVPNDSLGLLQDVHWSQGSFGYFPSYLLGSIFDGMLLEHLNNKLGNINTLLKEGRIKEITKYLNQNIHQYGGTYNINEVAIRLFNQELTAKPLINYFKDKYQDKANLTK